MTDFNAAAVTHVLSTAGEIIIASKRIRLGLLHALTSSALQRTGAALELECKKAALTPGHLDTWTPFCGLRTVFGLRINPPEALQESECKKAALTPMRFDLIGLLESVWTIRLRGVDAPRLMRYHQMHAHHNGYR